MTPLIEVRGVRKEFGGRRGLVDVVTRRRPERLVAVDDVDLDINAGEALGIVGESGCGKSTLARLLVGLHEPTTGEMRMDGEELALRRSLSDRRRMQIVFQDPYSSLNARMTIGQTIGEVLRVHRIVPRDAVAARVAELLGLVGLTADLADVYPRQLSGGQRQRVSIARALAVEPEVLIADEPVSALDVSMQATVLNLLADLRKRLGLTLVLIAHDLSVVRYVCDRVSVMYLGRIVETAPVEDLFTNPQHPYTRGLLAAAPRLFGGRSSDAPGVIGDPPSPYDIPDGCRFNTRCPIAAAPCFTDDPRLVAGPAGDEHAAACHFAWGAALSMPADPREETT